MLAYKFLLASSQMMAQHCSHYQAEADAWVEGDNMHWTNDPDKVEGSLHFSNNVPNVASHYKIDGLGPILRRTAGGSEYEFLCKDKHRNYYLADKSENTLYAYKNSWEMEEWEVIADLLEGKLKDDKNLVHFLDPDFYSARVEAFNRTSVQASATGLDSDENHVLARTASQGKEGHRTNQNSCRAVHRRDHGVRNRVREISDVTYSDE